MTDVLALALPFFGLILLGFGVGKATALGVEELKGLNLFVLYLALPALFFQTLARTPIEELAHWNFVVATTLSALTAFVIAFIGGLLLDRGQVKEATVQGLAGSYGNIGYLAPGLTFGAFGAAAAVPTALVICFDNTLMFTLAPLFMSIGGRGGEKAGDLAKAILRRVFLHPFILASLAGIAAAAVHFVPPGLVDQILTLLRQAAAPCALFAMGVSAASRPVRRVPTELPLLVLTKLVVHPALAYVLVSYFGDFDPIWSYTAVLMASLPTATNVFVLAQQYGVYVERASSTIVISTVASVVTVTAVLYLVTHRVIPPDLFPSASAAPPAIP